MGTIPLSPGHFLYWVQSSYSFSLSLAFVISATYAPCGSVPVPWRFEFPHPANGCQSSVSRVSTSATVLVQIPGDPSRSDIPGSRSRCRRSASPSSSSTRVDSKTFETRSTTTCRASGRSGGRTAAERGPLKGGPGQGGGAVAGGSGYAPDPHTSPVRPHGGHTNLRRSGGHDRDQCREPLVGGGGAVCSPHVGGRRVRRGREPGFSDRSRGAGRGVQPRTEKRKRGRESLYRAPQ